MRNTLKMFACILADILILAVSLPLGIFFRFDFSFAVLDDGYLTALYVGIPMILVIYGIVFYLFSLHKVLWNYAGMTDIFKSILATAFVYLIFFSLHQASGMGFVSRGVYAIAFVIALFCMTAYRIFSRVFRRNKSADPKTVNPYGNIMIIGAGDAGLMMIRDIKTAVPGGISVVRCVIDDNPAKKGRTINGIPIYGGRNTIPEAVRKYDIKTIMFCITECPADAKADILNICAETGCRVKTLPPLSSLLRDQVSLRDVRSVNIEDLLGRVPIRINNELVLSYVEGKVILVTGGGGSIGSELCRQIAIHHPKQLIIFDIYENNAYDIQCELRHNHPELNLVTLIGSVRDSKRLSMVFEKYHPQIIYHAAAHKHVPLMEDSPNESIKNNVFGTFNMATMADRYHAERFVMISTDKAVNPTNIMGASKRICEMLVQTFNKRSDTEFVAVRFGNVLGSNGSVIPLFRKQIEAGGPVTVTHPDIIRYFMTIPEAVSLVLQAGAVAKGGEIFVLDMGKPVKILDLAVKMIRLSGYEPYTEIKIEFSGLRPGEKLYEELLMSEEGMQETENKLIHIGHPIQIDESLLFETLREMEKEMYDDSCDIRALVQRIVPTYHPEGIPAAK